MAEGLDRAGEGTAPRWLGRDEMAAWLANSAIMISLPAALDNRMRRGSELTFYEYMVLSVLSEQPDRVMQMSDLAARTASSLSRLSHVVGRLEKRGLLTRARIPGSGRRTTATLTEAGHAAVVAAAPDHVAAVREYLVDRLTPGDLAALCRIGAAVDAALRDAQHDGTATSSASDDHEACGPTRPTTPPRSWRTARRARARFSVTVRHTPAVTTAIIRIDEAAWVPIRYRHAVWDDHPGRWVSDAEVAEVPFTAFTGRRRSEHVTARLIVRRVRRLNPAAGPASSV